MGKWKKRREREQAPSRAQHRAALLPTPDLVAWADATLYAVGRSLSEVQKDRLPEEVEDLLDNAQSESRVLVALVDEIVRRGKGYQAEIPRQGLG